MLVIVGRYSSIGDLNYLVDATIVSSKILNDCIKYICYKQKKIIRKFITATNNAIVTKSSIPKLDGVTKSYKGTFELFTKEMNLRVRNK